MAENYFVKDISLASRGAIDIEWAERHMPVLMKIRERLEKEKPLKGARIAACLHVTKETAVLMHTLRAGGAEAVAEPLELALGHRALVEVDEVHGDAALGEEALRLARLLAVLDPEDLDVHAFVRAARAWIPSHAVIGTAGVPGGLVRPVCVP